MNLLALVKQAGLPQSIWQHIPPDVNISGLALDSREVKPGFLFAALPGETTHGKQFIEAALRQGASAILTDHSVQNCSVPLIAVTDPARVLARLSAVFFAGQPSDLVAVTGTNGKSSTVDFLRQIWQANDRDSACLGTLGITTKSGLQALGYTTPDSILLHQSLQKLAQQQINDCAVEASSHGLLQRRLDGAKFTGAGFSNLTQDHFDYHADFADYFAAKQRLFLELLPESAPVVINVDDPYGAELAEICVTKKLDVWRIGWSGVQIKLLEIQPLAHGQQLQVRILGQETNIILPLVGEFQAANALLALALAMRSGVSKSGALAALEKLKGVRGRLELVANTKDGVPVLVDFAHSPDGLEKLLRSVRPHTKANIHLVFGCGGDRDPKKRPLMGKIANQLADKIIVTDDNPRSETPQNIRDAILAETPNAQEIADRKEAIHAAIRQSTPGDLIVVAGKGHEQGQIVGAQVFPFDDAAVIRKWVGQGA